MNLYTEANLNPVLTNKLRRQNVKSAVDSMTDINGKSAIIDLSSFNYERQDVFIKKLIEVSNNVGTYEKKIIKIPVDKFYRETNGDLMGSKNNPIKSISWYMKSNPSEFRKNFEGFVFVFCGSGNEYFCVYPNMYKSSEYTTFQNLIRKLCTPSTTVSRPTTVTIATTMSNKEVKTSPVKEIINTKAIEAEELKSKKEDLVNAVAAAADSSNSEEEALDKLCNDEYVKKILNQLEEEDSGRPKFNSARSSRMAKLNDEFMEKTVGERSVKDIIEGNGAEEDMPPAHMKISSINEDEWDELKFTNFQNIYDIDKDIMAMLQSLSTKSYPVSIVDINVEDTSTNQDYVYTYTVNLEDGFGKRSTLVFDIPKFVNNRFMRLRGNEKVMSGQLVLLPCTKSDEDTVQCVSNYNKIFIRRKGFSGKSYPSADRLIKAAGKYEGNDIKIVMGDFSSTCTKYDLPIDYVDIAAAFNYIETKERVYYFNQDVYYSKYNAKGPGVPYAINKADNSICYFEENVYEEKLISIKIANELCAYSEAFATIYKAVKPARRLNYSEASILAAKIPLIVVMGYSLGLDRVAKLAGIGLDKGDKRPKNDPDRYGTIKFEDGYITYPITYASSMLMNGLSNCNTESYSIADINSRSMWLDFLEEFGGRLLSDGLDNFADMFIDPITEEVCKHCKIPHEYFEMLIYANDMLADNKYIKHTDISGNRYRTNELVAGYFYKALSKSYTDYKIQVKRGRKVGMTMKRSAVIDGIMTDPMSSDLSILNPLLEIEAANSVSFKGLSGMNSDRSYGLDKRTYDESMTNKLALSTGFASNVGISRQTTIDMDVEGARGYVKQTNPDDMSVSKSFSMAEAITPFGTTHDDPFRSAMTFIQTSKHSMRTKKSMPLLITNGSDEAMAFIASNTFCYKAKDNGSVVEISDNNFMIVRYDNPVKPNPKDKPYINECISLKEEVKKNSDGGFYITLKLDTDLKVGDKFKSGDIIAYDKSSFSNSIGESDNLAYNLGVLAKVAIMNTDEGFEDSTIISDWMSESMATDVVVEKDIDISKNANVYNMVQVGQAIQEGDPLLIFQNSFDEKDANLLLKNITDPEFVSDLGRIRLKSKYTGVIKDIKFYRTCEFEEMSDSLKKCVGGYEKGIKATRVMYEKYGMPGANLLPPDYKMQPTGIMKNNNDGVKIVFYISYNDKMSVGDKCVAQSANKGVVKGIFPKGQEPFAESRPNEPIHAMFAARSFNARMVTSVWVSGAINKCMIELDRAVKEIMGIDWDYLEDMM